MILFGFNSILKNVLLYLFIFPTDEWVRVYYDKFQHPVSGIT